MSQSCPLAFRKIDGTITRLNAFSVFLLLTLFVVLPNPFVLSLLALDLMIRLFGNKAYSPVFQISKALKKLLHLKSEMVDAGAKRLASYFSLLFVLLILSAYIADITVLMYVMAAVFLFCLALELVFAYCIACKIYFVYRKLIPERL